MFKVFILHIVLPYVHLALPFHKYSFYIARFNASSFTTSFTAAPGFA